MAAFWSRSVRSRPVSAVSVLILTMLTVAAAAAGPLISRAIDASALAQAIATAPTASTDIVVNAQFGTDQSSSDVTDNVHLVAGQAVSSGLFRTPIETASAGPISWRGSTPTKFTGRVVAASDDCARIPLVSGRCPKNGTEVAVTEAAGRSTPPAIGSSITLSFDVTPIVFTVVGIADPVTASIVLPSDVTTLAGNDLVVSSSGLDHTGLSGQVAARAGLDPAALTLDRLSQAGAAFAQVQTAGLGQDLPLSVQTGLTAVLEQFAEDRRAADVLVLLVTVQALAASWLGAFVVFGVVAQERQREWALGRLRGLPRRRWLALVFGEPVLLLLVGAALGLALAGLAGRLAVSEWLRSGTPLQPWRIQVWSAASLAVLGSIAALVVASLRAVQAPLATLLREAGEPTRVTRLAAVSETVVLAAAVAAVIELRTSSDLLSPSARLALVTPAVLAAALGLLIIRALVAMGRRRSRRPARSLFSVVVLRRLTRTPTQLRSAVVIAIAVSVVVFSSQLTALSDRNRSLLAAATTGADTVLSMHVPAEVDYVHAVRQADPSGRAAMAVEVRNAVLDAGTSRVVAVDSQRLAAVAAWRPVGTSLSLADIARRLHPATQPSIEVRGSSITVHLVGTTVLAQGGGGRKVPIPQLILTVGDASSWQQIPLGTIRDGASVLTAGLPCTHGCRLIRVSTDNSDDTDHTPYTSSFSIASISTDLQPAATFATALSQRSEWRSDPVPSGNGFAVSAKPVAGPAGLIVHVTDLDGSSNPSFAPADGPNPLPALVASGTEVALLPGESGSLEGTGLNGQPQLLSVVGPQLILPRLLNDGVLVDLSNAIGLSDPSQNEAVAQLWLTPGAHPEVLAALARDKITVLNKEELTDTRHSLSLAATARAALISILLSLLVVLLAIAVLLAGQLLARERRRELLDVLDLARIGRARSVRLIGLEVALPSLLGAAIGVLAGVTALLLAGARLPLFAEQTVHQPLQVAPAWGALGLMTLAIGLGILILAAVTAVVETGHRR